MFIKGETYRHRNCLDVDMHVQKVKYKGVRVWKLKVIWVLRNGVVLEQDKVSVKKKDFENWTKVA
jgi:hypothetical protein